MSTPFHTPKRPARSAALGGLAVVAIALSAAAPQVAWAQIKTPVGVLYPEIRVATDYRYDGFSNSDNRPTVQAGVYLWRPDNFYAGAEIDHVRYHDGSHIDVEVDVYGGRNFDFGDSRLTLEAMAVTFPDQQGWAPTYSFVQTSIKARRRFGRFSLGGGLTWTPQGSYHSGQAWHVTGEASVQATPWASFSGKLGVLDSERGQDRTYWDAGVTLKRGQVAFDLRYTDTNLSRSQCFYTDRCKPGVVGKLTFTLASQRKSQGDRK